MDRHLISVVVPCYRAERYLPEALSSVFSQTFTDWELLVVDDDPESRAEALVRDLSDTAASEGRIREGQVRYLKNEKNLGAAGSRNRGVREAEGAWIAFLDADDAWEPEKLEKQLSLLAAHPETGLLFTGSAFMDESGRRLDHVLCVPETVSYGELLKQNVISCSSVLVKKELMLEFPMPEVRGLHEDFACWLSILSSTGKCARGVNEPLLVYRVSLGSQSGNKKKAALMNWRVYRHMGLGLFSSLYYEFCYACRGLRKWRKIR